MENIVKKMNMKHRSWFTEIEQARIYLIKFSKNELNYSDVIPVARALLIWNYCFAYKARCFQLYPLMDRTNWLQDQILQFDYFDDLWKQIEPHITDTIQKQLLKEIAQIGRLHED